VNSNGLSLPEQEILIVDWEGKFPVLGLIF